MGGQNTELQSLRDQILKSLVPLLANTDMPVEQKFALQLNIAETSEDIARFKEAYETAEKFPDETSKANAYLDLLEAIDGRLGGDTVNPSEPEPEQNTTSEPVTE
jgi:hypothetical protein